MRQRHRKKRKFKQIFEYTADELERGINKAIPHHLIWGPCNNCIVKACCSTGRCGKYIEFIRLNDAMIRRQMMNYFDEEEKSNFESNR